MDFEIFLDENLPPRYAKALDALSDKDDTVEHLRERFLPGTQDIEWLTQLGQSEYTTVVISHDLFNKNKAEAAAIRQMDVIVFCAKKLEKYDILGHSLSAGTLLSDY